MSGHSKWSTIKHKKGALDHQRGNLFGQLSKNIRVAVKEGKNGDPNFNPLLRLAVDKARAANMPKENIQRAVDRGLGKSATGQVIQEMVYEGFGPQGIGIIAVGMTDNVQRTSSQIRTIFSRGGGSLSGPHSVLHMFERRGEEYFPNLPYVISDPELIAQIEELIENLRSNDDIEDVFCVAQWETQE